MKHIVYLLFAAVLLTACGNSSQDSEQQIYLGDSITALMAKGIVLPCGYNISNNKMIYILTDSCFLNIPFHEAIPLQTNGVLTEQIYRNRSHDVLTAKNFYIRVFKAITNRYGPYTSFKKYVAYDDDFRCYECYYIIITFTWLTEKWRIFLRQDGRSLTLHITERNKYPSVKEITKGYYLYSDYNNARKWAVSHDLVDDFASPYSGYY